MNFTDAEAATLEKMGISRSDMLLVGDLAKKAAENAIDSIEIVANLAPNPRLRGVIILMASLMVGDSAKSLIAERVTSALRAARGGAAVRDFDGKFS